MEHPNYVHPDRNVAPTEQGLCPRRERYLCGWPTENIQRVEMKDDFTKVEISKADMTDGRELPVQS